MIKKILVTGASGYIGSVLTPMLLKKGYHVRAYDRFFFGDNLAKHQNLEKVFGDTRHLQNKHFKGIDAVIDLAAISNDPSGEYFKKETYDINHHARANCARLAKKNKVKRYILPSSCSIYGFNDQIVNEQSKVNPLTAYAKANYLAEKDVLPLASNSFGVTVIRQATIFGYSPRMRFDLAINGMTEGAYQTGKLPIMRNGKQIRPMLHIKDTSRAMIFLFGQPLESINQEIFNIGSQECTKSIKQLASIVQDNLPGLKLQWYGNPDHRSYNVDFSKIESLGFKINYDLDYGVKEILQKLKKKKTIKNSKTITLQWYQQIEEVAPYILLSQLNKNLVKIK